MAPEVEQARPAGEPAPERGQPLPSQEVAAPTETDEERLLRLEAVVRRAMRESAEALREIHDDRLYQTVLGYSSFEDYCECRWLKSRDWGYKEIRRLEVTERLERLLNVEPVLHLSVKAAQKLVQLADHPEELVRAYTEATSPKLTEESARKAVERQQRWLAQAKDWDDQRKGQGEPLHYDEWQALEQLGGNRLLDFVAKEVREKGGDPAEALVALCIEKSGVPTNNQLLQLFRGDDLRAAVEKIASISQLRTQFEAKRAEVAKLRQRQANLADQLRIAERDLKWAEDSLKPRPAPESSPPPTEPGPMLDVAWEVSGVLSIAASRLDDFVADQQGGTWRVYHVDEDWNRLDLAEWPR